MKIAMGLGRCGLYCYRCRT